MSLKEKISKIKHHYIWNNKFISIGMIFNFVLNIAYLIFIAWIINGKDDIVPLHYSIYFGIDNFGPIKKFLLFPEISFAIFLINSFLCYYYYKYSRILSYFLLATSLIVNIFMILSYILIILFIEL